jgi:hypothetical protein
MFLFWAVILLFGLSDGLMWNNTLFFLPVSSFLFDAARAACAAVGLDSSSCVALVSIVTVLKLGGGDCAFSGFRVP